MLERIKPVIRRAGVLAAALVILAGVLLVRGGAEGSQSVYQPLKENAGDFTYYKDIYQTYDLNRAWESEIIPLDIGSATALDGDKAPVFKHGGERVIRWDKGQQGYRFDFSAKEGLYQIKFRYAPLSDTASDIIRSITIDSRTDFIEMNNIKLKRNWVSKGESYLDGNEDERAPPLEQREDFLEDAAHDIYGLYSEPLLFYLKEGSHTLELMYVSGSMALSGVELVPYRKMEDYAAYQERLSGTCYKGDPIKLEGEESFNRSDRTLMAYSENDTTLSPFEFGYARLNTIGGWNWRNGNEEISWRVNVPRDGLYKLAVRYKQNYNGLVVYRKISIDREVPFRELLQYPFYTRNNYGVHVLGGEEPYLFYLSKGEHELSMSAVTGELTPLINDLQVLSRIMSDMVREIQTVTGINPDPNFDYELDKKLPWLTQDLSAYSARIKEIARELQRLCKSRLPMASALLGEADKLDRMVTRPGTIPRKTADISIMTGTLADYSSTLKAQPLAVDYIELADPKAAVTEKQATLWDGARLQYVDFVRSFTRNEDIASNTGNGSMKTLNVWVSRGREWGEAIQRMADETFTPKFNVKVNVNILPPGYTTVINGASPLLLSIVSGTEPDIAMGSDMDTPIELAIRNSLVDLTQFADFEAVAERFSSAAVDPFLYRGGIYGLPETMDFPLMIYRKDIIGQYGIPVPQTWDELWTYTIPQLKQANANFYMNSQPQMAVNTAKLSNFATFLYQNGGDFYDEKGDCTLDSEAANKAFNDWTKSFIQYQSPQAANFYNEMRTGTLPMGIGYTADYLMLDIAAPELYGRVGIVPIPGISASGGEIIRYGAGSVTSAIMFKKCQNKPEAWEFMKWWTETETQERFASEIEARVGPTARWFSANLEAFFSLPWGNENADMIRDWLRWYKNPYNTLGGYMTSRSVNNAWTRCVMSGMKTRDSLEQAFKEIAIQIQRKKYEYGVE